MVTAFDSNVPYHTTISNPFGGAGSSPAVVGSFTFAVALAIGCVQSSYNIYLPSFSMNIPASTLHGIFALVDCMIPLVRCISFFRRLDLRLRCAQGYIGRVPHVGVVWPKDRWVDIPLSCLEKYFSAYLEGISGCYSLSRR